jgi:hypothetical protein
MSLDKSNSASDRLRVIKDRVIYSNYLANQTRFSNGLNRFPPKIIDGTGASNESSANTDLKLGILDITLAEQAAIIAANAVPIVSGSILFASNKYLQSGLSVDFSMGTSNFTAECWANTTQAIGGGWTNLVTFGSAAGNDIRVAAGGEFFNPNTGYIGFIIPNTGNTTDVRLRTNYVMTPNRWYHFALVRNGSIVKFYINGVSQVFTDDGSGTLYTNGITAAFNHSGDVNGKSNLFINSSLFTESQFNGLISNIRLVKGLAVYTSNFTVPTVPLVVVGDTRLLMNTATITSYLTDGSSYNHTLTATGAPTFSGSNPFT